MPVEQLIGTERIEGASCRAFKYMSFEVAMDVITNCHFRISRISSLNDPFEWSFSDRNVDVDENHSRLSQMIEELDSKCGILCFSRDHSSQLMWAHYADAQRGVVLEVDVPGLMEVHYGEQPTFEEAESAFRDPVWSLMSGNARFFLRKRKEWQYEHELRKLCFLGRKEDRTGGVKGHHDRHFKAKLFGNKITILGEENDSGLTYYWHFPKSAVRSRPFRMQKPGRRAYGPLP